jgi:hypothetical protein
MLKTNGKQLNSKNANCRKNKREKLRLKMFLLRDDDVGYYILIKMILKMYHYID